MPLLLLALIAGCARYEFDITEPPNLDRHVGKDPATIVRQPLQYTLQAAEGRLVIKAFNPTEGPITLFGDESFVVDPSGQSHPLPTQTIAARSFIKLILPPLRPFYPLNPSWSLDMSVGAAYPFGYFGPTWYDDYAPYYPYVPPSYDYGQPLYLSAQGSDTYYWSWDGQTPVRLRLTFRRDNAAFHHDFTFHRRKV